MQRVREKGWKCHVFAVTHWEMLLNVVGQPLDIGKPLKEMPKYRRYPTGEYSYEMGMMRNAEYDAVS
jgi:hypothetical protein